MKAAVVEYPSGRHEFVMGGRVTAHQVMLKNPGFYVAKKSPSPSSTPSTAYLKAAPRNSMRTTPSLLPADAPLRTGSHYRLLTFEEVFYQFARVNRVEFMFSPRLRSSRMMQQPMADHSQVKRRSIFPFKYHSSASPNKKGMTSESAYKHPSHKSYF